MHRFIVVFAALAGAALLIPAALADKPSRDPLPAPPTFTISGSCSFDVRVDVLSNKEFITTFASGKQIVTGQLFVRVTNLSTGKAMNLNISGPGIEDLSSPSIFNLSGTSLVFFPGVLALTRGPITLTFDAKGNVTSFTQTSASSLDLCRALR
jgi:hypothetical protein